MTTGHFSTIQVVLRYPSLDNGISNLKTLDPVANARFGAQQQQFVYLMTIAILFQAIAKFMTKQLYSIMTPH